MRRSLQVSGKAQLGSPEPNIFVSLTCILSAVLYGVIFDCCRHAARRDREADLSSGESVARDIALSLMRHLPA